MTSQTAANADRPLNLTAYAAIKRDIVRCEFKPGSQISEHELVERYDLGRAAVRTALNRLFQEGLVTPVPRQGYVVAAITLKNVRELFAVRLLLEPEAARLAAGRASSRELEELADLCRSARYRLGDGASAEEFLRRNTAFHVGIAEASGNDRLATIIASLLDEMERLFHLGLMLRDRNDEMYHEHHDLVDALMAGDGTRAAQVVVEQIEAAQEMVTDALLSDSNLAARNLAAD